MGVKLDKSDISGKLYFVLLYAHIGDMYYMGYKCDTSGMSQIRGVTSKSGMSDKSDTGDMSDIRGVSDMPDIGDISDMSEAGYKWGLIRTCQTCRVKEANTTCPIYATHRTCQHMSTHVRIILINHHVSTHVTTNATCPHMPDLYEESDMSDLSGMVGHVRFKRHGAFAPCPPKAPRRRVIGRCFDIRKP